MMPGKNPVRKKAEIILRYEKGASDEKEDNAITLNLHCKLNRQQFGITKIHIDAIKPNAI